MDRIRFEAFDFSFFFGIEKSIAFHNLKILEFENQFRIRNAPKVLDILLN